MIFDRTSPLWTFFHAKLDALEATALLSLRTEENHAKMRELQGQLAAVSKLRAALNNPTATS